MTNHTITQKHIAEAAQLFHWATQDHFNLWFTGETKHHRKTQDALRKMVANGEIVCTTFEKRKVYAAKRRVRNPNHILKVYHGLGCTEGLVRFWWSRMDSEIIQERFFYGCGCIPEWGLRFPNGKMLLYEFSTENDFHFSNKIKSKLNAYRKYLEQINQKFKSDSLILFVLDVPREKVKEVIQKEDTSGLPVFFVDYETFKKIPITKQLSTPIYFWGEDGKEYPLSKDDRP